MEVGGIGRIVPHPSLPSIERLPRQVSPPNCRRHRTIMLTWRSVRFDEGRGEPIVSANTLATLRSVFGRHLQSLIIVAVIASAWLLCNRLLPDHPVEPGEGRRLVVLPFDFHGPASEAYLGEGVASLVSTALDGVDSLKCVELEYLMT